MKLHEALRQISDIRLQLARSERFRGYRAAPIAFSGVLAVAAGFLQALLLPDPVERLDLFLTLWLVVAGVSVAICLVDMWLRVSKSAGLLHRETTYLALGQFFPCLVAGGLLTLVIVRAAPQSGWMLPGLWAILFSLGIFASWRLLPRLIFGTAVYYLGGGLAALSLGNGPYALSPWMMPLLFGVGQLLSGAILLFSERDQDGVAP